MRRKRSRLTRPTSPVGKVWGAPSPFVITGLVPVISAGGAPPRHSGAERSEEPGTYEHLCFRRERHGPALPWWAGGHGFRALLRSPGMTEWEAPLGSRWPGQARP